jgi:predicted nucleic acid-binding protein
MRVVFADTFYWIALLSPRDNWHSKVIQFSQANSHLNLVITDGVVDEVFASFSKQGSLMRSKVVSLYQSLLNNPIVEIIYYNRELRRAGIELYQNRLDKGYSLTDCISMVVMKNENITEVLTNDYHFTQEGFKIIFPNSSK